ncbi:hypothetical protein OH77DRAFT_1425502 [Trametes cingulata]|nr:hypothetical protein OH77DRAFT_1425502 [Trametes cingulata]
MQPTSRTEVTRAQPEQLQTDWTFPAIYFATASSLQSLPSFRHVSREKLSQAAMDMTIVALGIRTGYLFDAFAIRDKRRSLKEVLVECLNSLRKGIPQFAAIVLLHEAAFEQLFFVNVHRLHQRHTEVARNVPTSTGAAGPVPLVTFIQLGSSNTEIYPPPPQLLPLFADILSQLDREAVLPLEVSLSVDTQDMGTMVAFAACVLDFPVAYDPTYSGPFLAGVPLDVYECTLELDDPRSAGLPEKHVMLKFSCPHSVAESTAELHAEAVIRTLKARFEGGLAESGYPGRMVVRHSMETLDRVAL